VSNSVFIICLTGLFSGGYSRLGWILESFQRGSLGFLRQEWSLYVNQLTASKGLNSLSKWARKLADKLMKLHGCWPKPVENMLWWITVFFLCLLLFFHLTFLFSNNKSDVCCWCRSTKPRCCIQCTHWTRWATSCQAALARLNTTVPKASRSFTHFTALLCVMYFPSVLIVNAVYGH